MYYSSSQKKSLSKEQKDRQTETDTEREMNTQRHTYHQRALQVARPSLQKEREKKEKKEKKIINCGRLSAEMDGQKRNYRELLKD